MIIKDSSLVMQSASQYQEFVKRSENLRVWVGKPAQSSPAPAAPLGLDLFQDRVELSEQVQTLASASPAEDEAGFELTPEEKMKVSLIETLLEIMSGRRIRIKMPQLAFRQPLQNLKMFHSQPAEAGWGLQYDYSETRVEHEQVSFKTRGQVQTSDGKTIDISVSLNMSRTFISHQSLQIRAGNANLVDPLVIHFDAPAAALTERNFHFDLDNDGQTDQISFVRPGSGFLTLDKNGDGIVNNGTELFGPQSGDGFAELAAYDEDGNGWIDEADPVFDRLRIWTRDAQGNQALFALGEKGIGAVYLGHAQTEFSMRDSQNQENGQLRSSGIFLRENGTAGIIQQIDLTA